MPSLQVPWIAALALLCAAPAHAGQDLTTDVVRAVERGKGWPSFTVNPRVEGRLQVELSCGGRSYAIDQGMAPGRPVVMSLANLPEGVFPCSGRLHMALPDGRTAEMPLQFEVASLHLFTWEASGDDFDREGHSLVVHPSRPLREAQLQVIGLSGVLEQPPPDLSDPSRPTFGWLTDDEVIKLVVQGVDEWGFAAELELIPWWYAIPHEDVHFDSGRHAINSSEAPKLERTWEEMMVVVNKYGGVVPIKLYVSGYTDTVGAPSSNQALSERRARSIAQWFRSRGFKTEVWYQGFGEQVLAVATPDETDEIRNRRAIYVLAADFPPVQPDLPHRDWKRL